MANTRPVVQLALLITGGIVLLQLPFFLAILNLTALPKNFHYGIDSSLSLSRTSPSSVYPSADANIELLSQQLEIKPGFKPLSSASYPFILFSTYRHTLESIYVLGITSVIWRQHENNRPVFRCEWLPSNGSHIIPTGGVVTEAEMMYVRFDENGMHYVPAIVNCTFNQSVGADGLGGLLLLHVSRGPNFWPPNHSVEFVFKEERGEVERVLAVDESELAHSYAYCGPPMYGNPNMDWIREWLAYHHYLWRGRAHFYLYDIGGLSVTVLEPWIRAGVVTIIDAPRGDPYQGWYRHQVLFINDCVYRTRVSARWTFTFDLDELLYVPAPNSIESLLEQNRDAPWMTFANLRVDLTHCRSAGRSSEGWVLERALWHEKAPECMQESFDPWLCVGSSGRRKYLVNPRKVFLAGVHKAGLPETGGVNFSGHIARVNHFRDILSPHNRPCEIPVTDEGHTGYDFDNSTALLVPHIKEFAGPLLNLLSVNGTVVKNIEA